MHDVFFYKLNPMVYLADAWICVNFCRHKSRPKGKLEDRHRIVTPYNGDLSVRNAWGEYLWSAAGSLTDDRCDISGSAGESQVLTPPFHRVRRYDRVAWHPPAMVVGTAATTMQSSGNHGSTVVGTDKNE